MRVERARLRQREQPLDVVVHAFEPGRVPRPDLRQRPAARVGPFEPIEAQQRVVGGVMPTAPTSAQTRGSSSSAFSRSPTTPRPAIDAPCGSTRTAGRRAAGLAGDEVGDPDRERRADGDDQAHRVAGARARRATRSRDGCRSARRTRARAGASASPQAAQRGTVAASGRASKAREVERRRRHRRVRLRARRVDAAGAIDRAVHLDERPGAGGLVQQVDVLRDQPGSPRLGPRASARGRPARDGPRSAAPPGPARAAAGTTTTNRRARAGSARAWRGP